MLFQVLWQQQDNGKKLFPPVPSTDLQLRLDEVAVWASNEAGEDEQVASAGRQVEPLKHQPAPRSFEDEMDNYYYNDDLYLSKVERNLTNGKYFSPSVPQFPIGRYSDLFDDFIQTCKIIK